MSITTENRYQVDFVASVSDRLQVIVEEAMEESR